MSDSIPLKRCSICGELKPATREFFSPCKGNTDKLEGRCKPCNSARAKQRRSDNPERTKEINNRSREKHKERRNQNTRDWFAAHPGYKREWEKQHPDKVKEYKRTTRQRHADKISLYNHDYHQTHIDGIHARQKKYRVENRPKLKIRDHNRRSKEYGLPNTLTTQQWDKCLEYWGNRCCICGRTADFWHIIIQEHWIPMADNRPNNPGTVVGNILPMCHSIKGASPQDAGCNNKKWRHDPVKWLVKTFGERNAVSILKRVQAYFEWAQSEAD